MRPPPEARSSRTAAVGDPPRGPVPAVHRRILCAWAASDAELARGWEEMAADWLEEDEPREARKTYDVACDRWVRVVQWLLSACAVGALLTAAPVAAQSDVALLMRTTASECGWDCEGHEIAALHAVIAGTAEREGVSYRRAWALLSPRLAAGSVSRRWLADIDERCVRPAHWPEHVYERAGDVLVRRRHPAWSAYVDRCGVLAVLCAWVQSGYVRATCDAPPRAWGSSSDVLAREALSDRTWIEVDCGETRNRFGEWADVDRE